MKNSTLKNVTYWSVSKLLTVKKVGNINDCEVNNILVANVVMYFLNPWSSFKDGLLKNVVMHVNVIWYAVTISGRVVIC